MSCQCSFDDTSYLSTYCGTAANITVLMSLVDIMLRSNCRIADPCRRATPFAFYRPEEYDFIVVGGGVAGPVVASRLSENYNWKVLLLEAGPEEPTTTSVPAFSVSAIGTKLDWGFRTQPQKGACLNSGGVCYWPRGKMMGGTGSMTGMMYTRGNKDIYNGWAKNGNVGWSYEECLPFFKMSETNKNPDIIEKEYHGTDGPLVVQQFPYQPQFAEDLLRAGEEIGYRVGDLNGFNQTGINVAQMMVEDGIRSNTPRVYLRPHHNRKNLVIKINSRVTRVLINEQSKRAEGVEFIDIDGTIKWVRAKKEVILSAGAVGSPHLLLLSGVGPKEDLEKHNITVIQNLKVGQNLHNHVSVPVSIVGRSAYSDKMKSKSVLREYLDNGTGPMSCTGLTQVTAFLKSKYAGHMPDLQVFFDGFLAGCSLFAKEGNEGDDDEVLHLNARPTNILTLSKGYLTLKSNDPLDYPLIYSNYLTEERDVDILVDGIKKTIQITQTNALKHWNLKLDPTPKEKCAHLPFETDEYWKCVIRWYTGPENHPAGSCKMGPSATDAVVDPELRVHGIPNMRVIDASIFPYAPNSNPIAAIIMVAEKGSYMIQSAWNGDYSLLSKSN
ncbi:unnamed protein product [Nezara viridula]|uniref:Glucose-methanol-choline oxidoreductase N-terminal domain-containing protein n=1 Tax=Nezara viridula TaxID=85310 RepID=A0A9P0EA62_NEZVI|nr:unnamed protein product [Nezara viridula]